MCGRSKDLIIIHGKNHYPQDIEYSCYAVKEVKQGSVAAFDVRLQRSCESQMKTKTEEELVVVLELKEGKRSDDEYARIAHELTKVISADNGLIPAVLVIVAPKTIPKTTSGKISRSRVRVEFEKNQLAVVYEAKNAVGEEMKMDVVQEEGVSLRMNALEIEGAAKQCVTSTDQATGTATSAVTGTATGTTTGTEEKPTESAEPKGAEAVESPEVLLPSQMDGVDTVQHKLGVET